MAEFNPPVEIRIKRVASLFPEERFSASEVKCHEENYTHGHDIYVKFSLTNAFLVPENWTILENITSSCETTPTSWKLRLIFNKTGRMVSAEIKLKRTDSFEDQDVVVSMRMHVDHRFGYTTLLTPSDKTIKSNHTLNIEIPHIVPSEYKNLLMDGTLEFDLRFFIKDCHPYSNPPPKPSPVKKKKSPSPEKETKLPLEARWHHTQR